MTKLVKSTWLMRTMRRFLGEHPWLSADVSQRVRFKIVLSHLEKANGCRRNCVIDIGCRLGTLGRIMEKSLNVAYLDIESDFLKPLKGRDRVTGDGTKLPFRNGAFDFAVSVDTLEHLPSYKREAFIGELLYVARRKVIFTFSQIHAKNQKRSGVHIFEFFYKLFRVPYPSWYDEHNSRVMPHLDGIVDTIHKFKLVPFVEPYHGCLGLFFMGFVKALLSLLQGVMLRRGDNTKLFSLVIVYGIYQVLDYLSYIILRIIDVPPYYSFAVVITKLLDK